MSQTEPGLGESFRAGSCSPGNKKSWRNFDHKAEDDKMKAEVSIFKGQ